MLELVLTGKKHAFIHLLHVGSKYLNRAEKLKLFTIVRDPLDRFISGFTQSVFFTFKTRKYFDYKYDSDRNTTEVTMQTTNATAIKAYIHAMLRNQEPLIVMGHFYPMAG